MKIIVKKSHQRSGKKWVKGQVIDVLNEVGRSLIEKGKAELYEGKDLELEETRKAHGEE